MSHDRSSTLPPSPPLSTGQKLLLKLLLGTLAMARRLPDRPIYRIAFAVGSGLYLVMPAKRSQVRSNLRRVCDWLVQEGQATATVAAAAVDDKALDRLVRAAFGHWIVGYAEAALGPRYDAAALRQRVVLSDPDTTAQAMSAQPSGAPGAIQLAMHFGSVELSAVYAARLCAVPLTGPMEFVEHPLARAYFDQVRGDLGVTIVPIEDAAQRLTAALERGEAVGLVADRNVLGRGSPVKLFGAPLRLPIGPAVLSVQTAAPIYLQAIERTGPGAWAGRSVAIRPPPGATRREATRSILEQEARAFEGIIARAPEQWTTLFFEIWQDEGAA